MFLFISHWPELQHVAILNCNGKWGMWSLFWEALFVQLQILLLWEKKRGEIGTWATVSVTLHSAYFRVETHSIIYPTNCYWINVCWIHCKGDGRWSADMYEFLLQKLKRDELRPPFPRKNCHLPSWFLSLPCQKVLTWDSVSPSAQWGRKHKIERSFHQNLDEPVVLNESKTRDQALTMRTQSQWEFKGTEGSLGLTFPVGILIPQKTPLKP